MTKGTPNKALERFINTNQLDIRIKGWVKRPGGEEKTTKERF
jgi:hypothetical protein